MEKITPAIENMLNEKLELYRQIHALLLQEREAIVQIDVEALWKSAELKKEMAGKVQQVRQRILGFLEGAYGVCDMDMQSFSVAYLVRNLPVPASEKVRLGKIRLAIDHEKNLLAQTAVENQNYVREYMAVIDDIMSVAVDNSGNAQYTQAGAVSDSKTPRCLIHAEV